MATIEATYVQRIGETAGQIWHHLEFVGPQKISQIVKEIDAPRDLIMQALGWLAREEKIVVEELSRSRVVTLLQ